jgi:hypothetical protein
MKLPVLAAALGVSLVAAAFAASPARADDDSAAYRANVGLHIGIAPVLLIPTEGGPLGGGLDLDARYGIPVGPAIIAPGGRLAGYYDDSHFIGIAMPTARVTFPLGPFAPFVVGGVGPGLVTNPSEGGVALLGGGGLMVHFGDHFALGAEATYQTITSTGFHELAIGPAILLSF